MFFFSSLFLVIFILIGVAYFTLFERKILGYIQFRKGPNSVGFIGLFQPFSDALSLFSSEFFFISFGNYIIYFIVPMLGLIVSILIWFIYPFLFNMISFNFGLMFFFCCSGVGVYFIMVAGWSSNSLYSMLGSIRSVAQSISYEICFFLIILDLLVLIGSFNLVDFYYFQRDVWMVFFCFPLFFVYFCCVLAESNRSPFDFSEGESELVSGFNVEYGSFSFSLFFLSEYSMMLFLSFFSVIFFWGGDFLTFFFYLKVLFFVFCFIWVRGTFPRYRYDKLMYMSWSCFLPLVLNYFLYFIFLSVFFHFIYFSL